MTIAVFESDDPRVAEAVAALGDVEGLEHLSVEARRSLVDLAFTVLRGDNPAGVEKERPGNVVEALAAVMRAMPGIGKDEHADPKQGGYAYRGIEAITAHAQGLLGRYGVVFIPRERSCQIKDIEVNGKPWTDTIIEVEYDVYGPGGPTDKIILGPLTAIGRDNSDKGANKCRTQAFKYALLQALCVSDAKDDSDSGSPEADSRRRRRDDGEFPEPDERGWASDVDEGEWHERLDELAVTAGESVLERWRTFRGEHGVDVRYVTDWTVAVDAIIFLAEHPDASPEDCYNAVRVRSKLPLEVAQRQAFVEWAKGKIAAAAEEAFGPAGDAGTAPAGESDGAPAAGPMDDAQLVEQCIAEAQVMRAPQVDEQLKARDLPTDGNIDTRRQRLAKSLIRERRLERAGRVQETLSGMRDGDAAPAESDEQETLGLGDEPAEP